jgi:hypothetical protein
MVHQKDSSSAAGLHYELITMLLSGYCAQYEAFRMLLRLPGCRQVSKR